MFSSTNPRLQVSSGVSGSSGYDFCSGHRRWGATQPGQLPELVAGKLLVYPDLGRILNLIVVVDDWSILMDIESDCGCGWLIHFDVPDWRCFYVFLLGDGLNDCAHEMVDVQPWRKHMVRMGYHTCCHLMSFAPLNLQGNYLDTFRHNQQWCICNFLQLHLALVWTKLMIIFVSLIGLCIYIYALGSLILHEGWQQCSNKRCSAARGWS